MYKLSGASLPKTLIYISDIVRLQRIITDLLHQYRVRPDKRAPTQNIDGIVVCTSVLSLTLGAHAQQGL